MLVASLLDQLKSDDAVLLMYLAGELPAEDRAQVDGRLAADANLRAELDRLRETYDAFSGALERDDLLGSNRPVVPEAVAARRVGREMLLWQARRQAMRVAAPASSGPRYPWWVYPVAAAASVVLAFLVWWGNTDRSFVGPDGVRIVLRPYNPQQPDHPQYTGTGAGLGEADPIMINF